MAIHDPDSMLNSTIRGLSLFFSALAVIGSAVVFSVVFIQKSEFSNQFIVYTGLRTHSVYHPNLFPVSFPGNDAYVRVYGCLMDAGIYRQDGECDQAESVKDFQACVRSRPFRSACDSFVTGADMGMLKCIQNDTLITAQMTNSYLECLDLSQSATYHTFQNIDSEVFLGAYNYAVLLVVGLVVMASFVLVTSGGWFHTGYFVQVAGKDRHISGWFSPFSIIRILIAFVWNFAFLVTLIMLSFSNTGVTNSEDHSKRFPMTLWTCALSIGVLALATAFYLSYLFEYFYAGEYRLYSSSAGGAQGDAAEAEVGFVNPESKAASMYHGNNRRRQGLRSYYHSASALTRRLPYVVGWNKGQYVGVKLYDNVEENDVAPKHVMSQMMQAYSWTWVFVDGLIFVGLLTPQAFITNESVVRVFVGIVAARLFQLAFSYEVHKGFLEDVKGEVDESRAGIVLSAIMNYAASLFCVIAVSVDYMSTFDFSKVASEVLSSGVSAHSIRIAALIVLLIFPELVRLSILAMMTSKIYSNTGNNGSFLVAFESLYTYEWITRFVISTIAIMVLMTEDRDQNLVLYNYFIS